MPASDLTALHPSLWRASQLGSGTTQSSVSSGFPQLDSLLPGSGWPTGHLIELLLKHQGIGELRFLMPVLKKMAQEGKWVVFAHPPLLPVANAFEQFGFPSERLVLIQANKPQDKLWSIEKLINSHAFGALVIWLPEQKQLLDQHALRRLQFHATQGNGVTFVFRPMVAQQSPSPAPLRLTLTADGPNTIRLSILKRRGPVHENSLSIQLPKPDTPLPGLYTTEELHNIGVPKHATLESQYALDSHHHSAHTSPRFLPSNTTVR